MCYLFGKNIFNYLDKILKINILQTRDMSNFFFSEKNIFKQAGTKPASLSLSLKSVTLIIIVKLINL